MKADDRCSEEPEDSKELGEEDLKKFDLSEKDTVIGDCSEVAYSLMLIRR